MPPKCESKWRCSSSRIWRACYNSSSEQRQVKSSLFSLSLSFVHRTCLSLGSLNLSHLPRISQSLSCLSRLSAPVHFWGSRVSGKERNTLFLVCETPLPFSVVTFAHISLFCEANMIVDLLAWRSEVRSYIISSEIFWFYKFGKQEERSQADAFGTREGTWEKRIVAFLIEQCPDCREVFGHDRSTCQVLPPSSTDRGDFCKILVLLPSSDPGDFWA